MNSKIETPRQQRPVRVILLCACSAGVLAALLVMGIVSIRRSNAEKAARAAVYRQQVENLTQAEYECNYLLQRAKESHAPQSEIDNITRNIHAVRQDRVDNQAKLDEMNR